MAFGFPAYHEEEVDYDVSRGELMDAALAALEELGWKGRESGRWRISSSTGVSLWSWGETIIIHVTRDSTLHIRSECALPTQCLDWGRNQSVVRRFLARLDAVLDDFARDRRRRSRDQDDELPEPRSPRRLPDRSVTPAPPSSRRPRPGPPDDAIRE
jgi:hypothetical protein